MYAVRAELLRPFSIDIEVGISLIYGSSAFRVEAGLAVCFCFFLEFILGYKSLHFRRDPISDQGSSFEGSMLEKGLKECFHHVRSKAAPVCLWKGE